MHILHIATENGWRGGENQLALLTRGLADASVRCTIAAPPGSDILERTPWAEPLPIPFRSGLDPAAVWRLRRYCQEEGVTIVDAQTSHGHTHGLALRVLAPRLRLVVHRRVDYVPGGGWAHRRKYLTPRVDRFVAISGAISSILRGIGVPQGRIATVPSAIDPSPYRTIDGERARARWRQGVPEGVPLIVTAAAMTSQKGYEVLLEALALVAKAGIPFRSLIAGDGELRPALEAQHERLGLGDRVRFLGWIDGVPELLAAGDIYAMPSNYEGLGTVIQDALHAGCCVVATRVGGIPEMVVHGEGGLLSPVGDSRALAEHLIQALGDAELRQRFAAAGLAHIQRGFSLEGMVRGNLQVYRELS